MHRLNDDLADIHSIMRQNIQEVLNRGERVGGACRDCVVGSREWVVCVR